MSFNPTVLNIVTVKKFVDRLEKSYKERNISIKRTAVQEDVAKMLGFVSYHEMSKKLSEKTSVPPTPPMKHASIVGAATRNTIMEEIAKSASGLSSEVTQTLNDNTLTVGQFFLSDALIQASLLDEQSKIVIARSIASDKDLNKEDIALLVDGLSFVSTDRHTTVVGETTRKGLIDVLNHSVENKDLQSTLNLLSNPTLTVKQLYHSDAFAQIMMLDEQDRISVAKSVASDPALTRNDVALLVDGLSFASQSAYKNESLDVWRLKKIKAHPPLAEKN